jgi:carbon-monoxide dehydrogenase medium subunit
MKPPAFRYVRALSVESAVAALASEADAKIIAGGQSLIPMMNLRAVRPACLIDINRLSSLDYIRDAGDVLAIGALARHNSIRSSPLVARHCPLLTEAYGLIANKTVRNRGTLGGNVCHADPASEGPAVLLATDATLVVRGAGGEHTIPAQEFFRGTFETAVARDELLTEIRIPKRSDHEGWAILEVSQRKGDFAMALVAATLVLNGKTCSKLRLAAAGIGDRAQRIRAVEALLEGKEVRENIFDEAAAIAHDAIQPLADYHADADYRRDLLSALTKRALAKASGRAGSGGLDGGA